MNYIFISPNYPAGHWRYVAALRNAGYTVLGIGDAGDETFPPELRGSLTEYYRVGDLHDYDAVYRACAYYVSRYGRIDDVESLNPYWLDMVESLNLELTAPALSVGEHYAAAAAFYAASEQLPPRVLVSSTRRATAFAEEHGFPLLVVPAADKRLGRCVVSDEKQLRAKLRGADKNAYFLYAQYTGEPVIIDGLCALDDEENEVLAAVSAHAVTPDGSLYSISLTDAQKERVLALVESTAQCGFFHIEAVRLPAAVPGVGKKGEILFNDILDAPPHEYIVDCMNLEFDCDLRALWAGGSESSEPLSEVPLEQKYFAAIACRSFDRSYKNPHEKVLRRLASKLLFHTRVADYDRAQFGDYCYVFRGEDTAELRRSIKFITEDHAPCR